MKTNRLTYCLLILAVFLTSCASRKNIESNTKEDIRYDFDYIGRLVDSLRADMEMQTDIVSEKIKDLKIENKTTFLSKPDSTGKQYPEIISETKAGIESKEKKDVSINLSLEIDKISSRIDSISEKVDNIIINESKEKSLSWWDLHKDKIYVGAFLSLIILILVIKFKR